MTELRERIGNERRRLREVREALSAALVQGAGGEEVYVPFYVSIGNYFQAAMARLHTQDIRMGEMLRAKLDMDKPEHQTPLAELDSRLAGNQTHLERFLAGRDALRSEGTAALTQFEAAARAYTDYITSQMGHHGASTDLARDNFSEQDWLNMAALSDSDMERERALYDEVFSSRPAPLAGAN